MIRKVQIKNFQSHAKTSINFVDGVNIITGSSDSGKTAIIRAIKFALTNRPSGDDFRSNWGGDTSVDIEFTDGNTLHRSKGSRNLYKVNGLELVAFGSDVPDEVLKCTNMADVNTQSQLDSPFLLSETAGAVAVHFNKIARIDQIDKGLRTINSWITGLDKAINYLDTSIKVDEEKAAQFEHLPDFETELHIVESAVSRHGQLIKQTGTLTSIIENLRQIEIELVDEEIYNETSAIIETTFALYNDLKMIQTNITQVEGILDDIEKCVASIDQESLYDEVSTKLDQAAGMWKLLTTVQTDIATLQTLKGDIDAAQSSIKYGDKLLHKLEMDFHNNFPDICPLCEK